MTLSPQEEREIFVTLGRIEQQILNLTESISDLDCKSHSKKLDQLNARHNKISTQFKMLGAIFILGWGALLAFYAK